MQNSLYKITSRKNYALWVGTLSSQKQRSVCASIIIRSYVHFSAQHSFRTKSVKYWHKVNICQEPKKYHDGVGRKR